MSGALLATTLLVQCAAIAQDASSGTSAPPLAPSIQTTVKDEAGASTTSTAQSQSGAQASDGTKAPSVKEQLSAFEDRFFAHTFSDESDTHRLDRIERVVYGNRRSGDVQQRLSRLMMNVPVITSSTSTPTSASATQVANADSPDDDDDPATPEESYNDYPTVTALEEQILHKTYEQLTVQQRLSQLETKAFGQPSTSKDLAARVDNLRQYVASKNNLNENYLTDSSSFSQPLQEGSIESEVSQMEQEVYGKTYGRDTLISRLNRLDNTVFAGQPPQTFTPITLRVNKLWSALQPKFSTPQTNYKYQYQTAQKDDDNKKPGHPIWKKIGHFVEGVGMVAGEAAGAAAAGSMMGYGYGGYGFGYPGYFGGFPYYGGGWGYGRFGMW